MIILLSLNKLYLIKSGGLETGYKMPVTIRAYWLCPFQTNKTGQDHYDCTEDKNFRTSEKTNLCHCDELSGERSGPVL